MITGMLLNKMLLTWWQGMQHRYCYNDTAACLKCAHLDYEQYSEVLPHWQPCTAACKAAFPAAASPRFGMRFCSVLVLEAQTASRSGRACAAATTEGGRRLQDAACTAVMLTACHKRNPAVSPCH
jgi:hypothetical protein